ncbi:hypothetical protein TRVA0_020S00936 [Trichomonascus vanleenenianus]|uniref:uncharacterized protein n=1 Tax=Trichomonascus vanleenenianus TaxID=2268995 RepID=UPI003ECB32DA
MVVAGKYTCSYKGCTKSFNRRDYLERHAANHLPVKPFVCEPCNRQFARSDLFENHLMTKFHLKRAGNHAHTVTTSTTARVTKSPRLVHHQPQSRIQIFSPPNSRRSSIESQLTTTSTESRNTPLTAYSPSPSPIASPKSAAAISRPVSDANPYHWLFEDDPTQDWNAWANRFDQLYSELCHSCHTKAAAARAADRPSPKAGSVARSILVSPEQALRVSSVLGHSLTSIDVSNLMDLCWTYNDPIHSFIHRPSFDAESQTPVLLAVIAILGMSYSPDTNTVDLAEKLFPIACRHATGFLEANKFASAPPSECLATFQAFTLLFWFEEQRLRNSRHTLVGYTRRFLRSVVPYISSTHPTPNVYIHTRVGLMSYDIIAPDNKPAVWREWIQYESFKRTCHANIYCDYIHAQLTGKLSLSIFDSDTHMPFPEPMWGAHDATSFFALLPDSLTAASQWSIPITPYLYVIRSMLRLPQLDDMGSQRSTISTRWSIYPLCMVIYGLIETARSVLASNDRGSFARVMRAFDLWRKVFESSMSHISSLSDILGSSDESLGIPATPRSPPSEARGYADDVEQSPYIMAFCVATVKMLLMDYHGTIIYMHEDFKRFQSLSSVLPSWVYKGPDANNGEIPPIDSLLELAGSPAGYRQWAASPNARYAVSAAAMYLYQRLSDEESCFSDTTTFYAVIIIWLHDTLTAAPGSPRPEHLPQGFRKQAMEYLRQVSKNGRGFKGGICNVIALASAMLNTHAKVEGRVDYGRVLGRLAERSRWFM